MTNIYEITANSFSENPKTNKTTYLGEITQFVRANNEKQAKEVFSKKWEKGKPYKNYKKEKFIEKVDLDNLEIQKRNDYKKFLE